MTSPKKLQSPSARATLAAKSKPYFVSLGRGVALGYRRNKTGAGTWVVRAADGKGSNWIKNLPGVADDLEASDGATRLSFLEAQDKARAFTGNVTDEQPLTVEKAIDAYARDLERRGKNTANATAARIYLTPAIANKPVSQLTGQELKTWRDGIEANPSTINRNLKGFIAALNQAASLDERIRNTNAWKNGLRALPDAERARDTFLTDEQVRALVTAGYTEDPAFGLFVELAAVTGARPSQIARLEVRDLQAGAGRVTMPTSDKGRGRKQINRTAIPLPASLVAKLVAAAGSRGQSEALLRRSDGEAWQVGSKDYQPFYKRARAAAGISDEVDFYSLRSSRIMRALNAGVPLPLIAKACDTSAAIIEKNYARHIANYAEDKLRLGLLDLAAPSNVVPFRAA
jgi:integrase